MKYHRFWLRRSINVVIATPTTGVYVWLSFVLAERLRNRGLSRLLTQHIITALPGTHHIHWPPGLKTFRNLSRDLHWSPNGASKYFHRCRAAIAYSDRHEPPAISPYFELTLEHTVTERRPSLPTIQAADASWILNEIRIHLSPDPNETSIP